MFERGDEVQRLVQVKVLLRALLINEEAAGASGEESRK